MSKAALPLGLPARSEWASRKAGLPIELLIKACGLQDSRSKGWLPGGCTRTAFTRQRVWGLRMWGILYAAGSGFRPGPQFPQAPQPSEWPFVYGHRSA